MSSLTPIQELRYNLEPRLDVNSFVTPVYKYDGYMRGVRLPRGSDDRHIVLEDKRRDQKHAENNRLIMDRPFN